MIGDCLEQVRKQRPLIHCLTNYVTINDVANILLASGASPIMADDPLEVEEITAISQGLTLNLGTLHQETMKSMRLGSQKSAAAAACDGTGPSRDRGQYNEASVRLRTA